MRRFVSSDKRFKPVETADIGPAERWQHSGRLFQQVDASGTTVAKVSTECQLDVLHEKGQVTPRMWKAGLKLRRDYIRAKVEPRTVMHYAPTAVRGKQGMTQFDRSEKEELAYKDWRIALQVVGVGLSDALVSVCCLDLKPQPRQQRDLIDALDALVRHYKL